MLMIRAYYLIKPILPWRFRLALRRWRAKPILRRNKSIWPIHEPCGNAPEELALSWPDGGKDFPVVLTHDVEGPLGLQRCQQLAEIEMEYGFRSSFNFIPQGSYKVPEELLAWLRGNGFEVGVHDLHHDGALFRSRHTFGNKAKEINRHLKEWGAVGFRAGFMLHELNWLHDLESSTIAPPSTSTPSSLNRRCCR